MIWFREAARFSHADRLRALPESAKAYHGVGTTSIFEGHGAANELLRVYKQAHHDGTLTMRSTLAFSANWPAAGDAPLGPFVEAWAGWLGEPGLGDDWLKMSGLYVQVGRGTADEVRAAAGSYTGWAGFNSGHGLPPDRFKELLLHCATNDIRAVSIAGGGGLGVLDFYEEVDKQIPLKGRRWVVSHVNVISPRDIERIARMGLVLTTHTNAYLYKALEATAGRLQAGAVRRHRADERAARGRRDGVARDRQRADLAVVSGARRRSRARTSRPSGCSAKSRRSRAWRRCAPRPRTAPI